MRWNRSERGGSSVPDRDDGGSIPDDADTVAALYRQHVQMVYGYLRASGVRDPDDLTSDIFVSMVRSLPNFRGGPDQFRAWLMTIAHRRLTDHWRRTSRAHLVSLDELLDNGHALDRWVTDQPLLLDQDLIGAMSSLTPGQREILALRFVADLSLETVAEITGRPVGAVKSMQRRALDALRRSAAVLEERWVRQ